MASRMGDEFRVGDFGNVADIQGWGFLVTSYLGCRVLMSVSKNVDYWCRFILGCRVLMSVSKIVDS